MKNIVVISDTHGSIPDNKFLWEAFDNADYIFHLGDGWMEIVTLKDIYKDKFFYVYGNSDGVTSNTEQVVEIEGVKLFLTHGHKYSVKTHDVDLQLRGEELGVKCCLFGHTHIPRIIDKGNILLVNPGSLKYARTYCYMSVVNGKALAKIVELRS